MLTSNYQALGWHVFSAFPAPLRQYALQIQGVSAGIKPACLFPTYLSNLETSLEFLRGLNLAVAIELENEQRFLHAQASPDARRAIRTQPRARLYLAKAETDAKRLARLENAEHDSSNLGLALGYPNCCVEAAAINDALFFDERYEECRQTNLNSCAIEKSTSVDSRCNILLFESDLSGIAPLSAIAHYPCRLDCPESAALGQAALDLCATHWPLWGITLCELLRSPVIYWSDSAWSHEFWDEYCGIALVAGQREQELVWNSRLEGIVLGNGRTPAGNMPSKVQSIMKLSDGLLCQDSFENFYHLPFKTMGHPWMIEWGGRRIQQLS